MIVAVVCGAGTGLGLWLVWTGFRPAKPDLAELIAALRPTPPPAPTPPAGPAPQVGWAARLGAPLAGRLSPDRFLPAPVRADLIVADRDPAHHLAEKVTAGLAGFLLPPVLSLILAVAGRPLPGPVPVALTMVLSIAGFIAPDLAVREEANRARAGLRHAFSSFLDLVVIGLAGGAGLEQALDDAASVGTGPAYTQLRRAIDDAALTGRPHWDTLAALGTRRDVPDIVETAASVQLAGGEGAKIRASLAARAAGIRLRQLTDADADATAATERMALPVVLLFAGFLLLIGFPAIMRVLDSL
ncbi:type II secretion system F family protein [Frankia sp. CiP3]|uniref:type II secretion system F family protein n=1 Tax=Frankia sp. CiP3 TaxID=2880971 RepID=UPI001EF6E374|nr:type II secretion system F family protein [Frankia sp. CiP3]